MTASNEGFLVFCAASTFPTAFGDPTIVVTAQGTDVNRYFGEYFTLYRGTEPRMEQGILKLNGSEIPDNVLKVDLQFMLNEAFQFALTGYRSILSQKYPQVVELNLFRPPFEIIPTKKAHLAQLWMRNEFHTQLLAVQQATRCSELRSFIEEVKRLPVITRA